MDEDELYIRFCKYACHGGFGKIPSGFKIYLSDDHVLGIPLHEDKEQRYKRIGFFKLKSNPLLFRKEGYYYPSIIRILGKMGIAPQELVRALRILKRRRKFELGLYSMDNGYEVWAIRRDKLMILVAPAFARNEGSGVHILDLAEKSTVTYEQLKKWVVWLKILGRTSE